MENLKSIFDILEILAFIYIIYKIVPFISWSYNEYRIARKKKRIEAELSDEDLLPKSSEEEILDSKIYNILRDGKNQQHQFARQEIRRIVIGEIMNRVKSESIKEEALLLYKDYPETKIEIEFKEECEKYYKRKTDRDNIIEELYGFLSKNNISEKWLLANGGFKTKPFREYQGGDVGWYNKQAVEYAREAFASYTHCEFGNKLPYPLIDKISDAELELLLKFQDRLINFHDENP